MFRKCNAVFIFSFIFSLVPGGIVALQSSCSNFIIKRIHVEGNEKTKEEIILFEAGLNIKDTLSIEGFLETIKSSTANLKRTGLFSSVEIKYVLDIEESCYIDLTIRLEENWLLFPSVILEIVDRNFNVWWNQFDHKLDRLNYGLGLTHYNLTGRKDKLRFKLVRGYSDKYELSCNRPYLTKGKNIEAGFQVSYIQSQEAPIGLHNSVMQFFSIDGKNSFSKYTLYSNISYSINRRTRLSFYQNWNKVVALDTIAALHPDFLLDGSKTQKTYRITLNIKFNNLNDPLSPTLGWFLEAEGRIGFLKTVERHRYTEVHFHVERAFGITPRLRYLGLIQSQVSLIREKPPFNQYKGIGIDQVKLSGFELYFIPGMDFVNISQEVYYKFFDYRQTFRKFLSKEPKIKINLVTEFVFKIGAGYVNDPYYTSSNTLANTNLGSMSGGIQATVNSIAKLEVDFSVNHLGEKGIYFHTIRSF